MWIGKQSSQPPKVINDKEVHTLDKTRMEVDFQQENDVSYPIRNQFDPLPLHRHIPQFHVGSLWKISGSSGCGGEPGQGRQL